MAGPRRGKRERGSAKGARILIVEARYYDDLADLLLTGAMKALEEEGAEVERISVPGSLEIPPAIAIAIEAAQRKHRPYDGVVALGCVIRGDTIHFEIVVQQVRARFDGYLDCARVCRSATASSPSIPKRRLSSGRARKRWTKAAMPPAPPWRWCVSSGNWRLSE